MIRALIPILLLAGAATAATPGNRPPEQAQADLQRDLAGLTPDKPQDCIRQVDARSSRTYGNTVLFKVSSGLVYRTDTSGGCSDREFSDALRTRSTSTRLCAGDMAESFDPQAGLLTGTCTFGQFTPYRRHK